MAIGKAVLARGKVYLVVQLDPTQGSEICKTRPLRGYFLADWDFFYSLVSRKDSASAKQDKGAFD